ncbi:MAG: hypothetical protein JNL81_11550 [Hyphomonadaceae bacterium]|nr:hypothetical protein [Hyphomonadaceae bacterium]
MSQSSQVQRRSPRERRKTLLTVLTFVFMTLYAVSFTADLLLEINLFWLTIALVLACTVCAFGWARLLDEGKINAHYVAWYWGGSAGLMVSSLIFVSLAPVLVSPNGMDAFIPQQLAAFATNLSFAAGFLLAMIPAAIGYVAWWIVLVSRR